MQFASRLQNCETSAIRELFKLLGKPGIISFAGGFPDPALFDVEGFRAASTDALLHALPAATTREIIIPDANHDSISTRSEYLEALSTFLR